jgi:phenylpyruvate tautomerase PptA (4-oxalocrotonate tautomerase family)
VPQVAIQLRDGRDPQSIRGLITAVTAATVHWANGDVTLAEKAALQTGSGA